jgi:Zn-dependent protease
MTDIGQLCKRCSQPVTPGALECSACHTLVHADEMERLAAQARALEARNDLPQAHQMWQQALQLLPGNSQQAVWIQAHLRELETAINNAGHGSQTKQWAKRLAPLGPIAAFLAKGKALLPFIFKLKFFFSFVAFIGVYWALWGPKFGIGFAVLILIHELGHYVEIKRRGLPAELPVFIPGLVAYVRWDAMGVSLNTRAAISLAGPMAGFLASAACAALGMQAGGDHIWIALAYTGAWLNLLNLIPVAFLDGAGAMLPLSAVEKGMVMTVSAGIAYATHQTVFWFIAAGSLWNLFTSRVQKPVAQGFVRLDSNQRGDGQSALSISAGAVEEKRPGSPLIAAYYILVLALLGAVTYLLPGDGNVVR